MSESTPSIAEALRQLHDARLIDVHTATPGVVRSYDPITQRVDVQPILKTASRGEDGERQVDTPPVLRSVPLAMFGTERCSVTFDLQRGDTVWLMFAEGSMDSWLGGATGVDEPLDPGDDRRHSLSDAVAYPCRLRKALPCRPGALTVNADDIRLGSPTASERVALHSELLALRDWVAAQFAAGAGAGHVHGVSGNSTTTTSAVPTPGLLPPTPVGSSVVRVDE